MTSEQKVLSRLLLGRVSNVQKMSKWTHEDFQDMLETYQTAKSIAQQTNELEAIAILEEKISQINEAIVLKSNQSVQPEPTL